MSNNGPWEKILSLAVGIALFSGCSFLPKSDQLSSGSAGAHQSDSRVAQTTKAGIAALRTGRTAEAVTAFNRALSLAPSQAELHMFAGLAYHLDYLYGNYAASGLAETGYVVATQLDPSLLAANLQLGRLYLDTKRFSRAQTIFTRILETDPDHAEAAYGLAMASYYARDLKTALGAARLAKRLQPTEARFLRAAALIQAATGFESEARITRNELAAVGTAQQDLQLIDRRMAQWNALHADPGRLPIKAQANKTDNDDQTDDKDTDSDAKKSTSSQDSQPIALNWADCKQLFTDPDDRPNSDDSDNDYDWRDSDDDSTSSDETASLQALPSPCSGRPMPRMVVIDAAIVRTEEIMTSQHGINLLDGLQIVFNWSNVITRTITDDVSSTTKTRTSNLALPQDGVIYSLNIANAEELRNDLLARPSLVALDRQPSIFFSGTNITIAIPGQLSGGDLEEKSIGVSLSVTPTFVDDDTILLAVKAARSGVEPDAPGTFSQSLHTTRSSVKTNVLMRMDQTLVISGLVEKENTASHSRTPVLGDVPMLQYLFKSAGTEENRKSILVVLTPRRPATTEADNGDGVNIPDARTAELRDRMNRDLSFPPGALSALRSLATNRYITQYRTGDLKADDWKSPDAMDRLLRDLGNLLYF
jgi:tetratricopeptide (TPR) repeat protein